LKIVVTGALGHIGSQLIRSLPGAFPGAEVVLLDDLSSQRYCSLFNLPAGALYRFIERSVLEGDLLDVLEGADAVVHLAAVANPAESFARQEEAERINFHGTERVALGCARTGAPLLFVSTTSVYGGCSPVMLEDGPPQDLQPQSPYAQSKLRAERLLDAMARERGLRYLTCRFGTVFGPSPGMRFHTAVNKFCWQAVNGLPLTVWKTALHQKRPYLDLLDAIAALQFLIGRGHFDGSVFNVLTLNASVQDVLEALSSHIAGISVEHVHSQAMNELSFSVSSERFKRLGFAFKGNLHRGIGDTIDLLKPLAHARQRVGRTDAVAAGTV
jgi:UDP-glucose 4-epimerase